MNEVLKYGGLAYATLSGVALICAGCAKAFPQVTFFAKATNVIGVVAFDVQKLLGLFQGGAK